MSESDDEEVNRREVAYRLFAAEFDDSDYSYAESDEERAPNYVVTPTGARVNRVFVVGVLTEVEQVSEDVLRARVVDPTGAFVVYAGQYQPEALAALESADTPSFVAVTGKARTFQPDDADVVYTSIRPEAVSEVDAETRDRWVVATAEQTVDRVATMAAAHERVERGDTLREILEAAGVQPGLAAGIPLALDHYGTTPAYLETVRELALDAARVVAGEADAAGDLSVSPGDGGDATLDFAADLDVPAAAGGEPESEPEPEPESTAADSETASSDESAAVETPAESAGADSAGGETDSSDATATDPADTSADSGDASADSVDASAADSSESSDSEAETAAESTASTAETTAGTAESGANAADEESASETAVDAGPAAETPDPEDVAAEAAPADEDAAGDGEMYELSEEERQEVKENYDVEFSSGTEIPESTGDEAEGEAAEPGEEAGEDADAEATDADAEPADDELGDFDAGDEAFDEAQADGDTTADFTEDEYDEPESDAADAEGSEPDLDLEDYVVDLMDALDDGDGARREEVVATAADERDADEGEIEDAIQDALMSGRCYESGDDHLKAI